MKVKCYICGKEANKTTIKLVEEGWVGTRLKLNNNKIIKLDFCSKHSDKASEIINLEIKKIKEGIE